MADLSKRLRDLADAMENGPYVSLKTIRDTFRKAADALEWKPIKYAPRDGTPVLVFCPNEEPQIVAAKYVTDSEWSGWVFVEMLLQETMPEGPEGPTHFTPIPSPPGGE